MHLHDAKKGRDIIRKSYLLRKHLLEKILSSSTWCFQAFLKVTRTTASLDAGAYLDTALYVPLGLLIEALRKK